MSFFWIPLPLRCDKVDIGSLHLFTTKIAKRLTGGRFSARAEDKFRNNMTYKKSIFGCVLGTTFLPTGVGKTKRSYGMSNTLVWKIISQTYESLIVEC